MLRYWLTSILSLATILSALLPGTAIAQVAVTNLGLASDWSLAVDGSLVAFKVKEADRATDLNGDGDQTDDVIHVYDTTTKIITNLGLDTSAAAVQVDGSLVVFPASEADQAADLNGDGDQIDDVVHVYDADTGTTTNLRLAGWPRLEGRLVAFRVIEADQGTDLNSDGGLTDNVVHIYNADTGSPATNLGLASNAFPEVEGSFVAFNVSEADQATDLNGDGDQTDLVVHVYDSSTETISNLGLAWGSSTTVPLTSRIPRPAGSLVPFSVSEADQTADLNGDGDTTDFVLHVYDAAKGGLPINLALASSGFPYGEGSLVAFGASEIGQGRDLNGDGDSADVVVHVHDTSTGTTTNLGLRLSTGAFSGAPFRVEGSLVAFGVQEDGQGTDLNGDGDTVDSVIVHVYDADTGTTTNLRLASTALPEVEGSLVVFGVREYSQANADLNGDGDAGDIVLHVYNISTSTATNLLLALRTEFFLVPDFQVEGNLVVFGVPEARQTADLNGDGDQTDNVVHMYDADTGILTNLGLASSEFWHGTILAEGSLVAFGVREADQSTDLNGDEDTSDLVPHIFNAADIDGDDVPNAVDNCPTVYNDQTDINGDGFGDACVDPNVTIGDNVDLGYGVEIGEGATIESDVTIGNGASIANDATLKEGASIGDGAVIEANATIEEGASIGVETVIREDATVKEGAMIGDGTVIGSNATIEVNAVVGSNVTIGNDATVKEGATIGDGTVIGAGATIEVGVAVGSNVTIGHDATIKANVPDNTVVPDGATWE